MSKKILIVSFSNLKKDPIVYRQINYLKQRYTIYTAGNASSELNSVEFISLSSTGLKSNSLVKDDRRVSNTLTIVGIASTKISRRKVIKNQIKNKGRETLNPIKGQALYNLLRFLYYSIKKVKRIQKKAMKTFKKSLVKKSKMITKGLHSLQSKVKALPYAIDEQKSKEKQILSKPEIAYAIHSLLQHDFDLIIANDLSALPLAFAVKKNAKILYDVHEYSLDQNDSKKWKTTQLPYNKYLLDKYLPNISGFMVTCDGSGKLYSELYRVPNPVVVMNTPYYHKLKPTWRNDGKIRLVHHGIAGYPRRLDLLIEAMKHLDDSYTLDFFLIANSTHCLAELKKTAENDSRIRFHDPVPMQELPKVLNQYDVGIAVFPPITKNLELALPNKFFEYLQARLAILIGPSIEMERIVRKYNLGFVSKDFSAVEIARSIAKIKSTGIMEYKDNVDKVAYQFSAETTMEILGKLVDEMLEA